MIRIFIGYDEGEKIAFHVLSESIRRLSSEPVSIVPLDLNTIKNHCLSGGSQFWIQIQRFF